jgi:hypothetical protein
MAASRNTGPWTLCALLAVWSGAVFAGDALDWLGPLRIGTSFREISQHVRLACQGAQERQSCTAPSEGAIFEGMPVQRIEAVFHGARFEQGRLVFGATHYPALLRALNERYGPGEDRSFLAIAGMAADFPAGVFIWRADAVSLVLEQYAGKIDRSSLTYGAHASMEGLIQKIRAHPRGARRNL